MNVYQFCRKTRWLTSFHWTVLMESLTHYKYNSLLHNYKGQELYTIMVKV